jgi:hypothetical protein
MVSQTSKDRDQKTIAPAKEKKSHKHAVLKQKTITDTVQKRTTITKTTDVRYQRPTS